MMDPGCAVCRREVRETTVTVESPEGVSARFVLGEPMEVHAQDEHGVRVLRVIGDAETVDALESALLSAVLAISAYAGDMNERSEDFVQRGGSTREECPPAWAAGQAAAGSSLAVTGPRPPGTPANDN